MRARHLESDVGARVAGADHQDRTVEQLRGIAVRARVDLADRGVQLAGEVGHDRALEGPRGHHDVVGEEPVVPGGYDVAGAVAGNTVDSRPGAHGQFEPHRVRLEVVGHLVSGRV
jgi:hypothetical protein